MDAKITHLHALTAFRFIAAVAVCAHHVQWLPAWEGRPPWPGLTGWLTAGYAGVPFFFILSGFVLTWNYHDRFRELGVGKVGSYLRARLARAYPLYLLTFFLSLATPFGWHGYYFGFFYDRFWRAFSFLTLTQGFWNRPDFYQLYNPVAWTLSAEAFFYVLVPFLLWGAARLPRLTPVGCLALAAGLAAFRVGGAAIVPLETSLTAQWAWYVFPPARLPEFMIGMLLALARLRSGPRAAGGYWRATLAEVGVLAVLIAQIGTSFGLPPGFRLGGYYVPTMAVLVWVFAGQRGAVSDALKWRPLQYFGELSYSLYMLHMLVFDLLLTSLSPWRTGWSHEWQALFVLTAAVAACPVSYHLIETPARWLLVGRRKAKPAVLSPTAEVRRAA